MDGDGLLAFAVTLCAGTVIALMAATLPVGIVYVGLRRSRFSNADVERGNALWSAFAASRGLALLGGFPTFSLQGALDGTSFTFQQRTVRRLRQTTRCEVTVAAPIPPGATRAVADALQRAANALPYGTTTLVDGVFRHGRGATLSPEELVAVVAILARSADGPDR